MKKFVGFLLIAFFIATGTMFLMPGQSEAVPAFARQTGQACVSCHFGGNYPVLSEFGREFKAGGFTMVGGQSLISGDALSLPSVLNAAVIGKFRYSKATGGKWELDMPDEMALFFGGRVGENIGFLLEVPIKGGNGGTFANFELPFEFHAGDVAISVVPFATDGAGPLRGYELLNTAWSDPAKPLERSKGYAAGRILGTDHAAEGITLAARKSGLGYVAYTIWRPNFDNGISNNTYSNALRAVYNADMGNWNVAAGLLAIFGRTNDGATEFRTKLFGLDAQLQGNVSNMPLGIYLSYGSAGKTSGTAVNLYNGNANNENAFGILAQLGVIPNKATLSLGGHIAKTGAATNDKNNGFIAGASYQYTQNVKFELDQEWYSGSANTNAKLNPKNRTTLMAFMGF